MMETLKLIVLLILSIFSMYVFMKCMTELCKRIDKLEKRVNTIKYQIDDVLDYINTVNQNMVNTYGLLKEIKDENK